MTTPTIYHPVRITTLGELRAVTATLPDDTPVIGEDTDPDGRPVRFEAYVEPEGIDPEGHFGAPDTRPALVLAERVELNCAATGRA